MKNQPERSDSLKKKGRKEKEIRDNLDKDVCAEEAPSNKDPSPWWERIFKNFRSCSGD